MHWRASLQEFEYIPDVLILFGPSESGKDTVGPMFAAAAGYQHLAFADGIRQEIWDVAKAGSSARFKVPMELQLEKPDLYRYLLDLPPHSPEIYGKPTTKNMRRLLQWWGEFKRRGNPDHWVELLNDDIFCNGRPTRSVITDGRRRNEMELVVDCCKRTGASVKTILVDRKAAQENLMAHHTEHEWKELAFDYVLDNNGDRYDLAANVRRFLLDMEPHEPHIIVSKIQ
jgi:hypothetical protein